MPGSAECRDSPHGVFYHFGCRDACVQLQPMQHAIILEPAEGV
jgi:hypothetical protein